MIELGLTVDHSYDDGEDVPTEDDGFVDEHRELLELVRAIPDPDTRRAVMALLVILVFRGRAGA